MTLETDFIKEINKDRRVRRSARFLCYVGRLPLISSIWAVSHRTGISYTV